MGHIAHFDAGFTNAAVLHAAVSSATSHPFSFDNRRSVGSGLRLATDSAAGWLRRAEAGIALDKQRVAHTLRPTLSATAELVLARSLQSLEGMRRLRRVPGH